MDSIGSVVASVMVDARGATQVTVDDVESLCNSQISKASDDVRWTVAQLKAAGITSLSRVVDVAIAAKQYADAANAGRSAAAVYALSVLQTRSRQIGSP